MVAKDWFSWYGCWKLLNILMWWENSLICDMSFEGILWKFWILWLWAVLSVDATWLVCQVRRGGVCLGSSGPALSQYVQIEKIWITLHQWRYRFTSQGFAEFKCVSTSPQCGHWKTWAATVQCTAWLPHMHTLLLPNECAPPQSFGRQSIPCEEVCNMAMPYNNCKKCDDCAKR